ncbi:MAG: Rieske 2Fe-2S domain-containing protein, partial [Deltaproteobacteria bacterium]|nr:Rieske 2Fe-2S domain-containing protein [Deltaproteobacteria bacterium]
MGSERKGHAHAMTRPDQVPAERYYDREFYELECERLWPRVWQMACRLEEIPKPGDFVEYENVGQSVIVIRQEDDSVKAFHNTCRHRGTRLVEDRGSCRE